MVHWGGSQEHVRSAAAPAAARRLSLLLSHCCLTFVSPFVLPFVSPFAYKIIYFEVSPPVGFVE